MRKKNSKKNNKGFKKFLFGYRNLLLIIALVIVLMIGVIYFQKSYAITSHTNTITKLINYSGGSPVSDTANILNGGVYQDLMRPATMGSYGSDFKTDAKIYDTHDALYVRNRTGTTTYTDAWFVLKNALYYDGKYYDTKTTILSVSSDIDVVVGHRIDSYMTGHIDVRKDIIDGVMNGGINNHHVEVKVKIEIFEAGTNNYASFDDVYAGLLDIDHWGSFYTYEKLNSDNAIIFDASDVSDVSYNSSTNNLYSNGVAHDSGPELANVYYKSKDLKNGKLNLVYGYEEAAGVYIKFGTLGGLPTKTYDSTSSIKKDDEVFKGDNIKYNIKYTNGNSTNSANVVIVDTLSKGLKYVSGSSNLGEPIIGYNLDGSSVLTWETSLDASSSGNLTYSATVNSDDVNKVVNSAEVSIGAQSYKTNKLTNFVEKKFKVSYVTDKYGSLNKQSEYVNSGENPLGVTDTPASGYKTLMWKCDRPVKLSTGEVVFKNSPIKPDDITKIVVEKDLVCTATHKKDVVKNYNCEG